MGFTSLGNIFAPSLGPILGGALCDSRFGWRGVFWFLALSGGLVLLGLVGWFPETKTATTKLRRQRTGEAVAAETETQEEEEEEAEAEEEAEEEARGGKRNIILALPNPLNSLQMLFHLPTGLILLSNGIVFASYYAVTAGIPSQFKQIYGLSDMEIGLVFIPAGLGSSLSAAFNGAVVDWNYRRKRDQTIQQVSNMGENSGTDTIMAGFPIERARLQIGGPMTVIFLLPLAVRRYIHITTSSQKFLTRLIVSLLSCHSSLRFCARSSSTIVHSPHLDISNIIFGHGLI